MNTPDSGNENTPETSRSGVGIGKLILRLVLIVAVIVAINRLAAWAINPEDFAPGHFTASDPMVVTAAGLYALLLALANSCLGSRLARRCSASSVRPLPPWSTLRL